jgi:transposase
MARYKTIDTSPRFLAVDLQRQLVAGTFEHALDWLVDHELDLTGFDVRYRNDANGAPAYPPSLLLKVVLFAYSRGMVSSRQIEAACRENVTFIVLSGDHSPHFTTIAHFVSTLGDEIAPLFARILYLCGQQGLIGREMFAIDGVKLPSNASKAKSGTRTEFVERATKLEVEVKKMVARHREADTQVELTLHDKALRRIERLKGDAQQIRDWLASHPNERQGSRGTIRKSSLTDNESAKMATSKGVTARRTEGSLTVLRPAQDRARLFVSTARAFLQWYLRTTSLSGTESDRGHPSLWARAVVRKTLPTTRQKARQTIRSPFHDEPFRVARESSIVRRSRQRSRRELYLRIWRFAQSQASSKWGVSGQELLHAFGTDTLFRCSTRDGDRRQSSHALQIAPPASSPCHSVSEPIRQCRQRQRR